MRSAADEALPRELAFLDAFLASRKKKLRNAPWLRSDFDDPRWLADVGYVLEINWSVPIGHGGELLTSEKHEPLWTAFRSWLLLQTDLGHTAGRVLSPISVYNRLRNVSVWIDYFLLHADRLGLPEHGLMALSANDFKAALSVVGSKASVLDSVYDWPNQLTIFLRAQIDSLSEHDLSTAIAAQPMLELPAEVDRPGTHLDPKEIVKARAWLWANDYYADTSSEHYRYKVHANRLATAVLPPITRPWGRFSSPEELALGPGHYCLREMPRASVVTSIDDRMSQKRYEMYRSLLHSLGALRSRGCAVPDVAGTKVDVHPDTLDLKGDGRYRSIPYNVVLYGLRRAIEFSLEHGDHLMTSFVSVAKAAASQGMSIAVLDQQYSIHSWLESATVDLGIKTWSIEPTSAGSGVTADSPSALSGGSYYSALRAHKGLYESLRVLYGAIQLTVGLLMARRQGTLVDLRVGSVLDKSRTRLVFRNRKSGTLGMRAMEARPIPPIGVRLISLLERVNSELRDARLVEINQPLFALPAWVGDSVMTACSPYTYNEALDMFCDYVEMPCNLDGERYYFRQHQLRRFFAMAFFWCSGLDHLDTLRWFLGHNDLAHLYNYITAETPGEVLRGVKAEWAADALSRSAPGTESLAAFLLASYGAARFQLLDQQALTRHIDDLLHEGRVRVEPEFLDSGRNYRILVVVTTVEACA